MRYRLNHTHFQTDFTKKDYFTVLFNYADNFWNSKKTI